MNTQEITKSILAILIVAGALAGLFIGINEVAATVLQTLGGAVVGYYFGIKEVPFGKAFIKTKKKK